ncbi:hypothetical protein ACSTD8_21940, partial [Vibrio vulnificus]|uniref:hypothetical protein n=1 Tax=Vibrio vulnificus TaxID=672 RepID=UPI003ED86600
NKEAVASSIWLLFFLLECDSKLTHYHPNWLNFNSDNYPARGGVRESRHKKRLMNFVIDSFTHNAQLRGEQRYHPT